MTKVASGGRSDRDASILAGVAKPSWVPEMEVTLRSRRCQRSGGIAGVEHECVHPRIRISDRGCGHAAEGVPADRPVRDLGMHVHHRRRVVLVDDRQAERFLQHGDEVAGLRERPQQVPVRPGVHPRTRHEDQTGRRLDGLPRVVRADRDHLVPTQTLDQPHRRRGAHRGNRYRLGHEGTRVGQ